MKNNENAPKIKANTGNNHEEVVVSAFVSPNNDGDSNSGVEFNEALLNGPIQPTKDPKAEDLYPDLNIKPFDVNIGISTNSSETSISALSNNLNNLSGVTSNAALLNAPILTKKDPQSEYPYQNLNVEPFDGNFDAPNSENSHSDASDSYDSKLSGEDNNGE
jgi:hypothetical protein